jgi:polyisoprenoid-binding protein YceI
MRRLVNCWAGCGLQGRGAARRTCRQIRLTREHIGCQWAALGTLTRSNLVMATWIFEPGHTAAEFRVRHMMVSWVRGHFKDVHGSLEFDIDNPERLSIETTIQAHTLWTGEPQRDKHLVSNDFLDAGKHATISFKSTDNKRVGASDYKVTGDLVIRGISRPVVLEMHYLGKWRTPYWTDAGDAGPILRVGFVGKTQIDRNDFGVSWQTQLENAGKVVGDEVLIELDIEALLERELSQALKTAGAG